MSVSGHRNSATRHGCLRAFIASRENNYAARRPFPPLRPEPAEWLPRTIAGIEKPLGLGCISAEVAFFREVEEIDYYGQSLAIKSATNIPIMLSNRVSCPGYSSDVCSLACSNRILYATDN